MAAQMTSQPYELWLAEADDDNEIVSGRVIGWVSWPKMPGGYTTAAPVVAYSQEDGVVYETRRSYNEGRYALSTRGWRHAERLVTEALADRPATPPEEL